MKISKDHRAIIIILDSVGIGELPDADKYNDKGSNTLGNLAIALGGLDLPNLSRMGLGNIAPIKGMNPVNNPIACYGKMSELSSGKDTTTGHWELMGIITEKPFPTYPNGFPPEILEKFQNSIGTKTIGNKPASGTAIIAELGEKHINTGFPIVYTSADSVFQIAAHEEIIPLEKLYSLCKTAREILVYPHNVSRVIARPFLGKSGSFYRTENRKDFSLKPPEQTILDKINSTLGIGKIWDIFAGQGITESIHSHNNPDSTKQTIQAIKSDSNHKLIFTNLVDFDMLYGHRNDTKGYYKALKEFDNSLPEIISSMRKTDLLIITADHGCDPTTESTDHSREYIPLLVYGNNIKQGIDLGIRKSFSDLSQTLADFFSLPKMKNGESFLKEIL
jgi:phosphopentomutase